MLSRDCRAECKCFCYVAVSLQTTVFAATTAYELKN